MPKMRENGAQGAETMSLHYTNANGLPSLPVIGVMLVWFISIAVNSATPLPNKHQAADLQQNALSATGSSSLMLQGNAVWQTAEALEAKSREAIKRTKTLRKNLATIRQQARKLGKAHAVPAVNELFQATLQQLASQVVAWQTLAGELRESADGLKKKAQSIMQQGFVQVWGDNIKHRDSLISIHNGEQLGAHNIQVRSVHPNIPVPGMDAMNNEQTTEMSLQRMAMSGQNIPPGLETSSFKISRGKAIFGHVEVTQEHFDITIDAGIVPINKIHQWHLFLTDVAGNAIHNARIRVEGHMPGHVHGLPTQPEIVAENSPGIYLVDGVKFQMGGWWVLQFHIEHAGKEDSIVFNLVL